MNDDDDNVPIIQTENAMNMCIDGKSHLFAFNSEHHLNQFKKNINGIPGPHRNYDSISYLSWIVKQSIFNAPEFSFCGYHHNFYHKNKECLYHRLLFIIPKDKRAPFCLSSFETGVNPHNSEEEILVHNCPVRGCPTRLVTFYTNNTVPPLDHMGRQNIISIRCSKPMSNLHIYSHLSDAHVDLFSEGSTKKTSIDYILSMDNRKGWYKLSAFQWRTPFDNWFPRDVADSAFAKITESYFDPGQVKKTGGHNRKANETNKVNKDNETISIDSSEIQNEIHNEQLLNNNNSSDDSIVEENVTLIEDRNKTRFVGGSFVNENGKNARMFYNEHGDLVEITNGKPTEDKKKKVKFYGDDEDDNTSVFTNDVVNFIDKEKTPSMDSNMDNNNTSLKKRRKSNQINQVDYDLTTDTTILTNKPVYLPLAISKSDNELTKDFVCLTRENDGIKMRFGDEVDGKLLMDIAQYCNILADSILQNQCNGDTDSLLKSLLLLVEKIMIKKINNNDNVTELSVALKSEIAQRIVKSGSHTIEAFSILCANTFNTVNNKSSYNACNVVHKPSIKPTNNQTNIDIIFNNNNKA